MLVIGVSKRYIVGTTGTKVRAKKYWYVYFYDQDNKFHCKRISFIQALYYKTKKKHKIKEVVCPTCRVIYKIIGKAFCPNCEEEIK